MINFLMYLMFYFFNKVYFNNMNYKFDWYKLILIKFGINVFKWIKCLFF